MVERRVFKPEEKMKIVMEGLSGTIEITELCRKHDIATSRFYDWKEKLLRNSAEIFDDRGRKNSSHQRNTGKRTRVVRLIRRTSEKEWKESVQYGKRWNVEIYFSGLKRMMGEVTKAVRPDYIAQEIALKGQYYNIMRGMTHAY